MKTKNSRTDTAVRIRFYLPLIPLFAAVVYAAWSLTYPTQITHTLDALYDRTPLSVPDVMIGTDDGSAPLADADTLSALAALTAPEHSVTPVTYCDAWNADGMQLRLISMASDVLGSAVILTDGRMPQNSSECIIAAAQPVPGYEIGAAIRPCGKDGIPFLSAENASPRTLTVVGIGMNAQTVLAPLTDGEIGILVYTADTVGLQDAETKELLYLPGCTDVTAVSAIAEASIEARTAMRAALAQSSLDAAQQDMEAAEHALMTHQITVQAIANRLETAELRVTEAESNMMKAVAEVQAERQEFVSDMQYNEYYALRQVDLIPRRNRAEEGFAKQEAVIAQINDTLHAAYIDHEAIRAQLTESHAILDELQAEADSANAVYESALTASQQQTGAQTWIVTAKETVSAHRTLTGHAAAWQSKTALYAVLCTVLFVLLTAAAYARPCGKAWSVMQYALLTAGIGIPAVLLGGCVLTALVYSYTYPALSAASALEPFHADTWLRILPLLPLTAVIAAGSAILGKCLLRMSRKKNVPHTQK